jgi:hypothetical protein
MYADKKFSYDDIIYAGVGLKDANWVDMMVMDITAGIFSHNGILPQVAKKILDDSFEREYAWSSRRTAYFRKNPPSAGYSREC